MKAWRAGNRFGDLAYGLVARNGSRRALKGLLPGGALGVVELAGFQDAAADPCVPPGGCKRTEGSQGCSGRCAAGGWAGPPPWRACGAGRRPIACPRPHPAPANLTPWQDAIALPRLDRWY